MSTWVHTDNRSWVQKLVTSIVKNCPLPLPEHVGFILDGNRRYAKGQNMETIKGHRQGFSKLTETNRWCLELGIKEISVYVFSIENFKRSKDEVDGLMILAKEMFLKLLEEIDQIHRDGICIEIIGDWSLIPLYLKHLMAIVMVTTKNNKKFKLNIAFAYTARNEMTRGVNYVVGGVTRRDLKIKDLSESLLENTFRIHSSRPLDLLIRTSGETRLSDFLLWQCTETVLYFTNVLWPDITYWDLLRAIFQYQRNHLLISKIVVPNTRKLHLSKAAKKKREFGDKIKAAQWENLVRVAASHPHSEAKSDKKAIGKTQKSAKLK